MPETTEEAEVKIPKRLVIKEAIEAGGATKENLMEIANCSSASLATNFTYLRLMGHYPVKAEDNTFSFVTEEAWEALQAERKAKAVTRKTATPKTPEATLAAAEKRLDRCAKAHVSAATKLEQFDNEVTNLRFQIASAEHRLAELALEDAKANMPEVDESIETVESPDETVESPDETEVEEVVADDDLV